MKITVFGLNFRTAPVEMRERLALTGASLQLALDGLSGKEAGPAACALQPSALFDEVVILSTCNRLEVYGAAHESDRSGDIIAEYFADAYLLPVEDLRAHAYTLSGDEAARHLMRVACGLDSMILGETQILGQVTDAFKGAQNAGATGPCLSHLFAQAIHAGKRARAESAISRQTTSISHAAALRMLEGFADPGAARVLVVGAGESATLAAQAFRRMGIRQLAFVNRTLDRAEALAQSCEGRALTWYMLDDALVWADAVLCATGAPHSVISRQDVEAVLSLRQERPLVIMDIAVPRDVESTVRELPGVHYHDIDDLQNVVDANLESRRAAVSQVDAIIEEEVLRFAEWHRGRQVLPVIKELREWVQDVAQEELDKTLHRLPDADDRTRQLVGRMVHQLVNRLLHEPTTRLRMQALKGNGYGYAFALRELFDLHEVEGSAAFCIDSDCPRLDKANGNVTPCNLQCIVPALAGSAE